MSPTWLLIPCTLVVFLAYDISRISVPEEALEPFNVRIFLYVQKLYLLRVSRSVVWTIATFVVT